jgi:hypothetical protein
MHVWKKSHVDMQKMSCQDENHMSTCKSHVNMQHLFLMGNPDWDPATSMTLVSRFCHMSSVRSTSDSRGPVTRRRVPDREEPGKPRKDARRGCCHPLEAGFWPLWMTQLLRTNITEYCNSLAQRVPDREDPKKPRKDARRGCCHPLE